MSNKRIGILGIQPKYQYGDFQKAPPPAGPIGGGAIAGIATQNNTVIDALLTRLGIDTAPFNLDRDDLLESLLIGLGIDKSSDIHGILLGRINLLDVSFIKKLNSRLNRILGFLAPDSFLCALLKLKIGNIGLILSGIISLNFDLCEDPLIDKILGNIEDIQIRKSILINLIGEAAATGNFNMMIEVINHPDANDLVKDIPTITTIIRTVINKDKIDEVWKDNNTKRIRYETKANVRPFKRGEASGNWSLVQYHHWFINGLWNVDPNFDPLEDTTLTRNDHETIIVGMNQLDPEVVITPEAVTTALQLDDNTKWMVKSLTTSTVKYPKVEVNDDMTSVELEEAINVTYVDLESTIKRIGFCA